MASSWSTAFHQISWHLIIKCHGQLHECYNHRSNILDPALVANINNTNLKDKNINIIDSKCLINYQINERVVGPVYNAINLHIRPSVKEQRAIPE